MNRPQRGGHRLPIPSDTVSKVLALAGIYTEAAIAEEVGISQPSVSNILVRHGQRRATTKRARSV